MQKVLHWRVRIIACHQKGRVPRNALFTPAVVVMALGKCKEGSQLTPALDGGPSRSLGRVQNTLKAAIFTKERGKLWTKCCLVSLATRCRILKQRRLDEIKALEEEKKKVSLLREAEEMAAKGDKSAEERLQIADEVDRLVEKRFGNDV